MGAARFGAEIARISRRAFLGSTLGTTAWLLAGCETPHSEAPATPANDLLAGDALDQAARVRSGQTTATELVEATIERIEALNGPINAVVTTFYERASSGRRVHSPKAHSRASPSC